MEHLKCASLGMVRLYSQTLEKTEKQSSILRTSVNYSCKSLEHWAQNVNYASKSLIGFVKVARAIYIYCLNFVSATTS